MSDPSASAAATPQGSQDWSAAIVGGIAGALGLCSVAVAAYYRRYRRLMMEAKKKQRPARRSPPSDRPWPKTPRKRSGSGDTLLKTPLDLEKGYDAIETIRDSVQLSAPSAPPSRFSTFSLPAAIKKPRKASISRRPTSSDLPIGIPHAWRSPVNAMPILLSADQPRSTFVSEASLSSVGQYPSVSAVGKNTRTSTEASVSIAPTDPPLSVHPTLYYHPTSRGSSVALTESPFSPPTESVLSSAHPASSSHLPPVCACDIDGETDVGGGDGMRIVCPLHGERPRTFFTATTTTYAPMRSKAPSTAKGFLAGWR